MEQVDEFVDPATLRHKVRKSLHKHIDANSVTVDVERQIRAYLQALQHTLRLQSRVLAPWFDHEHYEGTLLRVWQGIVLCSGLLDDDINERCAPCAPLRM